MAAEDSLEDQMDKASIEQLHKVVLQLSGNCFETKKLCATVIVAAGTLTSTFLNKGLDLSLFIGGLIVIGIFWVVDAQSYYYQEKIRSQMKRIAEGLVARRQTKIEVAGVGMPLSKERENWGTWRRAAHAAFNPSMFFYAAIGAVLSVLILLYRFGLINAVSSIGS